MHLHSLNHFEYTSEALKYLFMKIIISGFEIPEQTLISFCFKIYFEIYNIKLVLIKIKTLLK